MAKTRKKPKVKKQPKKPKPISAAKEFDISKIKADIEKTLKKGKLGPEQKQILKQRAPVKHVVEKARHLKKEEKGEWTQTGIEGFDSLMEKGIPKGTATLVCGGPGSGKTIFCLQILNHHASNGKKCIYMTFEESEERLRKHMLDFGWDAEGLEKKGNLVIRRFDPFEITRSVEALLEKAKGELLIEATPVLFPKGFKPDIIAVDSLSAIAAAFVGKEETYRIYIEQLFRLFEDMKATSFLITESTQIPVKITSSDVEEFLADGVFILYNIKRGNIRESAIEILKMRGAKHQKKIVAIQITDRGIEVYPEQEVFGGVE